MSRKFLKYYGNESDAIKGKRIVIEARRFGKLRVFGDRTSRHKGQRLTADNAVALIERGYVAGKNSESIRFGFYPPISFFIPMMYS